MAGFSICWLNESAENCLDMTQQFPVSWRTKQNTCRFLPCETLMGPIGGTTCCATMLFLENSLHVSMCLCVSNKNKQKANFKERPRQQMKKTTASEQKWTEREHLTEQGLPGTRVKSVCRLSSQSRESWIANMHVNGGGTHVAKLIYDCCPVSGLRLCRHKSQMGFVRSNQ